jgi:GMP synthase (glutamine-hydrolysing)
MCQQVVEMSQAVRLPIVIIQTGLPPDAIHTRHGNFSQMIRNAAGLSDAEIRVVAVHEGETLEAPERYCAALITGSPAMVTDGADWSERTAAWIRDAVAVSLPILGICYGHQLIAHALGGKVGYHPQGREVGTQAVELLEGAQGDPLIGDLPSRFYAHLIHQQSVLQLPPGAQVLARSSHDPHQIVRYNEHMLSTQYHPEFCTGVMTTYLNHYEPKLGAEGFDVPTLRAELQPTPHAQQMLQGFVQRYAMAA